MNHIEARAWVGRKVRGKVIDAIEVNGGPTDRRIYLMSEGERIMNVSSLVPADVSGELPEPKRGPRHNVKDKRPEVRI